MLELLQRFENKNVQSLREIEMLEEIYHVKPLPHLLRGGVLSLEIDQLSAGSL